MDIKEDKTILKEEILNQFIKNIASISKIRKFEENLLCCIMLINYEFWYHIKFCQCGINSFQLMNN